MTLVVIIRNKMCHLFASCDTIHGAMRYTVCWGPQSRSSVTLSLTSSRAYDTKTMLRLVNQKIVHEITNAFDFNSINDMLPRTGRFVTAAWTSHAAAGECSSGGYSLTNTNSDEKSCAMIASDSLGPTRDVAHLSATAHKPLRLYGPYRNSACWIWIDRNHNRWIGCFSGAWLRRPSPVHTSASDSVYSAVVDCPWRARRADPSASADSCPFSQCRYRWKMTVAATRNDDDDVTRWPPLMLPLLAPGGAVSARLFSFDDSSTATKPTVLSDNRNPENL